MMFGMKHSLCLISIESKTQPSESIPTKNGCRGLKERSFSLGDDCMGVKPPGRDRAGLADGGQQAAANRSEEHTSELQSRLHLVCRLLLEKKKKYKQRVAHLQQH